mmetsp:Transcript_58729/g.110552  ORF Transcript_58729/g.110552 Transcript_58729/m.110552 type:complete len:128 (-) Transcript_58729:295-678(-)
MNLQTLFAELFLHSCQGAHPTPANEMLSKYSCLKLLLFDVLALFRGMVVPESQAHPAKPPAKLPMRKPTQPICKGLTYWATARTIPATPPTTPPPIPVATTVSAFTLPYETASEVLSSDVQCRIHDK